MLALDERGEVGGEVEVGADGRPRRQGGVELVGQPAQAAATVAQPHVGLPGERGVLLGAVVRLGERLEVGRVGGRRQHERLVGEQVGDPGGLALVALDLLLEHGELVVGEPRGRGPGGGVEPGRGGDGVGGLLGAGRGGPGAGELGGLGEAVAGELLGLLVVRGRGRRGRRRRGRPRRSARAARRSCEVRTAISVSRPVGRGGRARRARCDRAACSAVSASTRDHPRVDRRGLAAGPLEVAEGVLLLDQEVLDGVAGLGQRGRPLGLQAADLLGVGLHHDLEVVDLAPRLALGRLVGRAGSGRGGGGVVDRAAHRAVGADGELARDLGRHPVEALLADLDQRLAGEEPRLGGLGQGLLGRLQLGGQRLGGPGRPGARAEHLEVGGERLGEGLATRGPPGGGARGPRGPAGSPRTRACTRSELGAGLVARAGQPAELALEVGGLPLERAHPGDLGEGAGRRALVLGDLLVVERGDAEHRRRASSRAALLCWSSSRTSARALTASSWRGRTPAARWACATRSMRVSCSGVAASTAARARRAAA